MCRRERDAIREKVQEQIKDKHWIKLRIPLRIKNGME